MRKIVIFLNLVQNVFFSVFLYMTLFSSALYKSKKSLWHGHFIKNDKLFSRQEKYYNERIIEALKYLFHKSMWKKIYGICLLSLF